MSAYKKFKTKCKDLPALIAAIEEKEPNWKGKIVADPNMQNTLKTYGYHGDDRTVLPKNNTNWSPMCSAVVPGEKSKHGKQVVPGASNDIGIHTEEDGTLTLIVSQNESGQFGESWQKDVIDIYHRNMMEKEAPTAIQEQVANLEKAGLHVAQHEGIKKMDFKPGDTKMMPEGGKAVLITATVTVKKKVTKEEYEAMLKINPNIKKSPKLQLA